VLLYQIFMFTVLNLYSKKSQNVPSCTLIAAHMEGVGLDCLADELLPAYHCFILEVIQIVNSASST
jgi:hypothetical protein